MSKYSKPPLVEAVCEFKLSEDTLWDITIPGILYEKLKDDFPKREAHVIQEIEIHPGPKSIKQEIQAQDRVFLYSKENNLFTQIGLRVVAINVLHPYPSWSSFKPKIEKVWGALKETLEIKNLDRLGLRYINVIKIPQQFIRLEDYFTFYPYLGDKLPQDMISFIVGSEFTFNNGRDNCRIILTNGSNNELLKKDIILDLDYFLSGKETLSNIDVLEWVEKAHLKIEEIFEGSIKDALRELFK